MIKVLPLEEKKETKYEPQYRLYVTLGYGEHCCDTFTTSSVEINDEMFEKFNNMSEEELDELDFEELTSSNYISSKDAEDLVKLFDSLENRKNKEGYEARHIVLNDGPSRFWWIDEGAMTEKEFNWFSDIYNRFMPDLFNPQVEHNWYGIIGVSIKYWDENGEVHKCEVI